MVLVFKNARERSTTNNYHPVSLFSVFSKNFKNLVNDTLADPL